jgi:2-oxoglutarate ferredoxin oxidoreductase subunit gamma
MVLNIVMLGFFTAMTKLLTPEAVRLAIGEVVPRGTEKLNLAAFEKGYAYGLEQN